MVDSSIAELPSSSKWVNENFILGDLLGSGTFGKVFTVQCRRNRHLYALKEISQSSLPKYIAQEIKIMAKYGGKCNIMNMHAAFRENGRVFVVMDHFPHDNFKEILPVMTNEEKLVYFKNLLIALEYLHSNNIIHRDVKPANFLYNRKQNRFALIDFGLSHEYVLTKKIAEYQKMRAEQALRTNNNNGTSKSKIFVCGCSDEWICDACTKKPAKYVNKAGTPGFRPPEVLLRFDQTTQTTALDIWSAGVVLLSLLFKRHPIFRPADDFEAIVQICTIIGSKVVVDAAKDAGVTAILPSYPGVDYTKLITIVRPGWSSNHIGEVDCSSCSRNFYGNTRGRCFCKKSGCNESNLESDEKILVDLLKDCLNPDPCTRYSATCLLLKIDEFERNLNLFY